jgi:hypothetical protein
LASAPGASARLPSYAGLLSLLDTALPDPDGPGLACNWLAKLLAAAGNPGVSTWRNAAARASPNDAAYSMPAEECGEGRCRAAAGSAALQSVVQ